MLALVILYHFKKIASQVWKTKLYQPGSCRFKRRPGGFNLQQMRLCTKNECQELLIGFLFRGEIEECDEYLRHSLKAEASLPREARA